MKANVNLTQDFSSGFSWSETGRHVWEMAAPYTENGRRLYVYAYQMFAYDKVGRGAAILSPAHFHLPTPTSENVRFGNSSPGRMCVPKFMTFHGCLGPKKCIHFGRKKEERIILTNTVGPSAPEVLGP